MKLIKMFVLKFKYHIFGLHKKCHPVKLIVIVGLMALLHANMFTSCRQNPRDEQKDTMVHATKVDTPLTKLDTLKPTKIDTTKHKKTSKDTIKPKNKEKVLEEKKEKIKEIISETIYIEGGTFMMGNENGDDDEKPVHVVKVNSFYIDKYEVTVGKYKKFCEATGREMPNPPAWGWKDNNPMVNVSWNDAFDYAKWAGKRLPTEAEWEYAARGGLKSKGNKFAGSNKVNDVVIYKQNSKGKPSDIGSKKPNEIGLYDMSGNVWEWCSDWYAKDYYQQSPTNNPGGPKYGDSPVLRGGSWHNLEENQRVTDRSFNPLPTHKYFNIGFRCVQDLVPVN